MRVIIIADHAVAEGGAPQVAIASAIGLADLGHQVTYIHGVGTAGDAALDAHPAITRISLGGADIWSKSLPVAARDGIWNREHGPRLAAILAGFPAGDSVVHVHQWTKYFSPSVFAVVAASGLPLVISMHDYFLACPTGLMYRVDRKEPCGLKPLSPACLLAPCDPRTMLHKAIRVARTLAAHRALNGAPVTALHVSEVGQRTIGHLLPAAFRQVVVENPVECADHGPRPPGARRLVTYCGRLTEDKGADLVAEAAKRAGLPSLFIGDGPLAERIRAIDPAAEITGWLDKPAVRARIAADALALVAPSRWPETGPLVIAEAMAAGVPVVVSNRAGASGRVVHGTTGFIVPPEAGAMAGALGALSETPRAEAMGAAAHAAYWADPPSPAAHARKVAAVYEAALKA